MLYEYRVYGLPVAANRPLPHLIPRTRGGPESLLKLEVGDEVPADATRLEYRDERGALEVGIGPGGRRVWMCFTGERNPGTIGDATAMLVGPVLGGLLRLWGRISLHGCAVGCGGRAVVVLGKAGAGKSTLAAAMAHAGHPVLSDDLAAISERAPGQWWVESGYPRLRLSPDSAAFFLSERDRAPDAGPVATDSDRRYASLDADGSRWSFCSEGMALAAVYELQRVPGCGSPVSAPLIGAEGVATLLRHLKPEVVPLSPDTRARELRQLTRLATTIPLRRLLVAAGFDHAPDTCALLRDGGSPGPGSPSAS